TVTAQDVGFTCARPRQGLWRWLNRPILEVHEQEEAPLLFTVHYRWGWPGRLEIRDAEDCIVGALIGRFILNEFSRRIAERRPMGHGMLGLVGPKGETLATLTQIDAGLRLEFRPEVENDPFLKMLLLAAALHERYGC